MKNMVEEFVACAKKAGIQRIGERAITIDDYADNFKRMFEKMEQMDQAISYKKKIIPISEPSFGKENLARLTDGIFGAFESWRFPDKDANWVAYKGKHMDFILDLGEVMPINNVEMDFLNVQAQANWHQLILPKFVTYAFLKTEETTVIRFKSITLITQIRQENPKSLNCLLCRLKRTIKIPMRVTSKFMQRVN